MGRAPCCDKTKVKRGPWSPEEDATLKRYLEAHGTGGNWIALPDKAGLKRCGKSCRLRWLNYLRPDIKHGGFTEEEDKIIFTLYGQMGSRWSLIASHLPGRTDNDVKNYWNTKLKKKLLVGNASRENKNKKTTANASADYNNNPGSNTAADPCSSSSSSLLALPKSENNNSSLSFWDSLTQSSVTLPMLSDHLGYDPIANTTPSLNLDDPIHFSLHGIFDMSELGANLINSQIVSPSQEGSSISDSSSIPMDNYYKCTTVSLAKSNSEDAASTGILMDYSRLSFPYNPVNYNGPLFEDQTGQEVASSTYHKNRSGFGYAAAVDDTKQQGQNQSVTNQY